MFYQPLMCWMFSLSLSIQNDIADTYDFCLSKKPENFDSNHSVRNPEVIDKYWFCIYLFTWALTSLSTLNSSDHEG